MLWLPFIVSLAFFLGAMIWWFVISQRVHAARNQIELRVFVTGSRGKSGTVRLVHAILANNGIPTYAKVTGTVAEEINVKGDVSETYRLGTISANEMIDVFRRARADGAKAAVMECMAVAPKLIAFVQNKVVQAPIVVIPTIRLDHLEDEGDTIPGIAKAIVSGLERVTTLVTGETNEEALHVMRTWAKRHHVELIEAVASPTDPVIPGHHPTNVAVAIAVAGALGIEPVYAVHGLKNVSLEPDAETSWKLNLQGVDITLSDVGGANDPQSGGEAAARALAEADGHAFVPILVNRWDRPLRALAFANALRPDPRIQKVAFIGSAVIQTRRALRRAGFTRDQIVRLGSWNTTPRTRALHTLRGLISPRVSGEVVMFENIHSYTADNIRTAAHEAGQPIGPDVSSAKGGAL